MTLESFLQLLDRVKKSGDEFTARCPAHDDMRNSLSVGRGDRQPVVVHCHAGCDEEQVLRALNLNPAALCQENGKHHQSRTEIAAYAYHDEEGKLLYESVRFAPKEFRFRRPDGDSGRVWKLGDARRVLYGLPELIEAVALDKNIYVVEGEKDVHSIRNKGGIATCNPGGAASWRKDYSPYFQDANVIIVADKDDAGRKHAAKVASSLTNIAASVQIVEAREGKDASDHIGAGYELEDFIAVEKEQQEPSRGSDGDRPTQAQKLLELAASLDCFHSPDQTAFVGLTVKDHREYHRIQSGALRRWLTHAFYLQEGKPPHNEALYSTIRLLEAKALLDGQEWPVFVRVGEHLDSIYIDLGGPSWEAISITADGWRIENRPAARFVRAPGMSALPKPKAGGSLDDLRPFLNVATEDDFRLVVGWLVAALRPKGPYPIEILQGEQGSAKSTTQRVQRALIDPSTAPLRSPPRSERDLVIAARNGWVLAIDNLSTVRDWFSDAMCRLSTGGGFSTRQLYTDSDEMLFDSQRPLLLNGIGDLATRDDLRDRALIINLPRIPDNRRLSESRFWSDFDEARPRLLGALLSAVSSAMRGSSELDQPQLPRMADFATWVIAAESGLGWPKGSFLTAYQRNRERAVELSVEFNPVASAILILVDDVWQGTATELLRALEDTVPESDRTTRKGWPSTPRGMSNALDRAAATLRQTGIEIDRFRNAEGRYIAIRRGHTRSS